MNNFHRLAITAALLGGFAAWMLYVRAHQPMPSPQIPQAPVSYQPTPEAKAARLADCTTTIQRARSIDMLGEITMQPVPAMMTGPAWSHAPFQAKEQLAKLVACAMLGGDESRALLFNITDYRTGKVIGRWNYTRLNLD